MAEIESFVFDKKVTVISKKYVVVKGSKVLRPRDFFDIL